MTSKRFPNHPSHPERLCWGCEKYCASSAMRCGNGSVRTPHPAELFGDDWMDWGLDAAADAEAVSASEAEAPSMDGA